MFLEDECGHYSCEIASGQCCGTSLLMLENCLIPHPPKEGHVGVVCRWAVRLRHFSLSVDTEALLSRKRHISKEMAVEICMPFYPIFC